MWLFFQVMMWKTVETRKRATRPRPYTQAVMRSQPVCDSRCSSAIPRKAGAMRSWGRPGGAQVSGTLGAAAGRLWGAHRVGVAVSRVLVAGGLVAAARGRSSVHEPETNITLLDVKAADFHRKFTFITSSDSTFIY